MPHLPFKQNGFHIVNPMLVPCGLSLKQQHTICNMDRTTKVGPQLTNLFQNGSVLTDYTTELKKSRPPSHIVMDMSKCLRIETS